MKNTIELNILGQKLIVKSDGDADYARRVEEYLLKKVEEVRLNTKAVATLDIAILLALNVSGELIKTREKVEGIEKRVEELTQLITRRLA